MKITNLSLIATLLLGSSAMALDNTKVTGDANLYYQTNVASFGDHAATTIGDASLNLNVTTELASTGGVTLTAGAGMTYISTLGLENEVVGAVWAGSHDGLGDATWITEAYVAATAGNTTIKIGRQKLDTPLAYTETWNIEQNSFNASVLINTDLPGTTIVAAHVAGSNASAGGFGTGNVATNGDFTTTNITVLGAINTSVEGLTAQAWYYGAAAGGLTWLQADAEIAGLTVGVQHTTSDASSATAVKVGGSIAGIAGSVAYSTVGDDAACGSNAVTANQSKLYTEAAWLFGNVTGAGASTVKVSASVPTSYANLGFSATQVTAATDVNEYVATASKSFGIVDATLLYLNGNIGATDVEVVQAYLSTSF
ncbi:MAG: hypothetical protein DSZ04_02630 [Sulfurimonas sp.]|nr:MAG: hypothetical protein DSZ04_02630 [Sulfurimonas sp.]